MSGRPEFGLDRLDGLLAEPVSVRSMALVRLLVGPVTLLHLRPFLVDGLGGDTYHDRFHQPFWSWYPELAPGAYTGLLVAGALAAAAMTIGVLTRVATAATFAVVTYNVLLSTTHLHNNRAYLIAVLLALALAPCGRALSVDAWLRSRSGSPTDATMPGWPLWLLRFECALVYGASGVSKLVDPDWFGGTVTWGRVVNQEAMVRDSVLPGFVVEVLLDRSFHTFAAKGIVLTELFIAAGLWWRRTRPWAVTSAIVFHVMIELSARVQIFSYLGISVLVVWSSPSLPWLERRRHRLGSRQPVMERTPATNASTSSAVVSHPVIQRT